MTQYFRPSPRIQSSTNFILTLPACFLTHLHMIIHGFVFEEGTKPAHEHHLQVFQRSQAWFSTVYRDLKTTPHNGF